MWQCGWSISDAEIHVACLAWPERRAGKYMGAARHQHPSDMKSALKILLVLPLAALLLGLAGYGASRAAKRLWLRTAFTQERHWDEAFDARKRELSKQPWRDKRPLRVLVGDSHIEFGNWYQAFQGALAVRNCGMATARIDHVTGLVASIREPEIDTLLLHCGINNLGRGDSPTTCLEQYRHLLDHASSLGPRRIVVVAVMPVRQSPLDSKSRDCNSRVREFNSLLAELCKSRGITLLDLKEIVADSNGGLKDEFTHDGLHLNPCGYAAITPRILEILTSGS